MGLIETAAGGALGLLLGEHNDARQIDQQKKLQALQIQGSKELTDYNYAKQYDMWLKTNYSAQRKQLEDAGLNPGLLYGMGGGGGSTIGSGSGGSVSGGNAPTGGGEALALTSQAMQLSLLKAQKENIEADTANKTAQANKTAGVDTELGKTQIASLTQGITHDKAKQKLTEIQTDIAEIDKHIKHMTEDVAIHRIENEANAAMYQMDLLSLKFGVEKDLVETRKQIVREELASILLRKELTSAQTAAVLQSVKTQIEQLRQGQEHINIDKVRNELIEKGIWVGAASNVLGTVVDLLKKGGKGVTINQQPNILLPPN